jgi:hypothetical protein
MKTYVLTVSDKFPQTHPKKGQPTYFPGQILDHMKIHTIRANYDLWAKRIEAINKGEAILSVRHWYEKPYRSPQIEICQFEYDEVGIEKLTFPSKELSVRFVNGEPCFAHAEDIAKNDGLSYEDFMEWFKNYDLSKPMAVIHFTEFRYL